MHGAHGWFFFSSNVDITEISLKIVDPLITAPLLATSLTLMAGLGRNFVMN